MAENQKFHCWQPQGLPGGLCLLESNHYGPHRFIPHGDVFDKLIAPPLVAAPKPGTNVPNEGT